MYIKLTRLDNSPIWFNAAQLVTIEPRKGGGTIVVPQGDGLDYEVREKAERILELMGEKVVAETAAPPRGIPPPKPVVERPQVEKPQPTEPAVEKPDVTEPVVEKPQAVESEESVLPPVEESGKKSVRKTTAKKPRATKKAKKPEAALSDEQVARLKKLAPGSLRKLENTLVSQFKVEDANAVISFLQSAGHLKLDQDHVVWNDGSSPVGA